MSLIRWLCTYFMDIEKICGFHWFDFSSINIKYRPKLIPTHLTSRYCLSDSKEIQLVTVCTPLCCVYTQVVSRFQSWLPKHYYAHYSLHRAALSSVLRPSFNQLSSYSKPLAVILGADSVEELVSVDDGWIWWKLN